MNSKLENDLMIMMLFSYSDLCSSQQTNNIVSVRDRGGWSHLGIIIHRQLVIRLEYKSLLFYKSLLSD